MKQFIHAVLLFSGIIGFSACSNGDYIANPSSNGNSAINPITPLTAAEFTWSGQEPLSADINGVHWKADAVTFGLDSTGANIMIATSASGGKMMYFRLSDVWSGNLYDLEFKNVKRWSYYADSVGSLLGYYRSDLGNSGEIKIVENDSAVISGLFYYEGVTPGGQIASIKNGYFKIIKPH